MISENVFLKQNSLMTRNSSAPYTYAVKSGDFFIILPLLVCLKNVINDILAKKKNLYSSDENFLQKETTVYLKVEDKNVFAYT